MWFRICHSPKVAVLGEQMIHVTAFLLTIEDCKGAEESQEDTHTFNFIIIIILFLMVHILP